jgi:hypothetical protein
VKKLLLIFLSAGLAFFSCKKSDNVLGLDVQPEGDLLYGSFSDNTLVRAQTVYDSSIVTSLNNLGIYLLGSYQDPVFGRSDASIYTNFILKDNITNINAGVKPEMDSVVLSLAYKTDFYGDTLDPLKLNVYLLPANSTISKDSIYKAESVLPYDPQDITESGSGYTFTPRPASKVTVGGTANNAQLRIRLSKTWFEENLLLKDNPNLLNTTAMQAVFKGVFITTKSSTTFSPEGGSILFFSLYDNRTLLTMYYHNLSGSGQKIEMTCGAGTGHFNNYVHDYGTAHSSLLGQIDNDQSNDTILGKQNVFIQSMAGFGTKIEFPDITQYCDSGPIAVAKAEIIIPVDEDPQWYTSSYKTPLGLGIRAYNAEGELVDIVDIGGSWVGGAYDASNKRYIINIPRHINQVCNSKIGNYGFFLFAGESASKPYRAVLSGTDNPAKKIKLLLTYTKLYSK